MRPIWKISLALLTLIAVDRFCRWQTDGFRFDKLHSDFVYQSTYAPAIDRELLKQPFTFLGSGVQSYVFLGQDGTTVLKLFKHYHNMPIKGFIKSMWLPSFLEGQRSALIQKRTRRLQTMFSSAEIAFRDFRQETGMLGIHLQPTADLKTSVTIIDRLGIAYQIDADTTAFILQKKVHMLTERIDALLQANNRMGVQQCLRSLVELIAHRCKKGVSNHDLRIERNIGFIDYQAMEIDVGTFKKMRGEKSKELRKELLKLKRWVASAYPEFTEYVDQEIETHL